MATLNTFANDLAIYAPTAARPFLDRMYYEAAREFFRRTTAWREPVEFSEANADGHWEPSCYGIDTGLAEVADYIYVQLDDDEPLTPLEAGWFKTVFPDHVMLDLDDDSEEPTHFYRAPYESVNGVVDAVGLAPSFFYDVVGAGRTLHGVATLMPARTTSWSAVYLPDGEMREYHEAIKNGALARLLSIPDQRWSNRPDALMYMALFENAVHEATTRATMGRLKGRVRRVKYGGL